MNTSNLELEMLSQRRRQLGFTQEDVANALGVSRKTIQRMEAQGAMPHLPPKKWVIVQHFYGLSIEQLAVLDRSEVEQVAA